jgi:hypothetical protein
VFHDVSDIAKDSGKSRREWGTISEKLGTTGVASCEVSTVRFNFAVYGVSCKFVPNPPNIMTTDQWDPDHLM